MGLFLFIKKEVEIAPGHVHRKYLNLGWIIALPVSYFFSIFMAEQGYSRFYSFIFCIWNYWLCRLIDPDLDHASLSISEGTGMRFFEKIWFVGWIFRALWMGMTAIYAGIMLQFGGHRSFLSHSFIVGTIGRIIFFNAPIFYFFYWKEISEVGVFIWSNMYYRWNMQTWLIPFYFSQMLMLSIGDTIHLILDTEIVKNVLYIPETSSSRKQDTFKPKYDKFIGIIITSIIGYVINKSMKIKNFRK